MNFSRKLSELRHDLRTPVGHVTGYAEMLLEDFEDTEEEHVELVNDLNHVLANGMSMLALIDEHLSASRTSLDQLDLELVDSRLNSLIDAVKGYIDKLCQTAEKQGCSDILPDLKRIHQATEVLMELSREQLNEKAFDDAVINTTDEPEQSDSSLSAASDVADLDSFSSASSWSQGGQLLIVDDDESNRDLLERRLTKQGYECATVESGQAALEWLKDHHCDLILLDLLMPGMDGRQTLEAIKKDPRMSGHPVIMLSAMDDMDPIVACIMIGAEDFLFKPCNPVLLNSRIGAVLEKVSLRRMQGRQIKVFISSPGDVIPERRVVRRILREISESSEGRIILTPILWEEEPLLASDTFQAQIESAAQADIYIGILWSRIGSPLPAHITRDDGSLYESGTVFEFEEALNASRDTGKPHMLIYRKTAPVQVELTNRDEVMELLDQKERLSSWLDHQLKSDDGESYRSAFHTFETTIELEEVLETHLRKLVEHHYLEDSNS